MITRIFILIETKPIHRFLSCHPQHRSFDTCLPHRINFTQRYGRIASSDPFRPSPPKGNLLFWLVCLCIICNIYLEVLSLCTTLHVLPVHLAFFHSGVGLYSCALYAQPFNPRVPKPYVVALRNTHPLTDRNLRRRVKLRGRRFSHKPSTSVLDIASSLGGR